MDGIERIKRKRRTAKGGQGEKEEKRKRKEGRKEERRREGGVNVVSLQNSHFFYPLLYILE